MRNLTPEKKPVKVTHAPRKRGLKFGKLRTADTSVLRKVVCPHEVVYMAAGKPAEYAQLSVPLFVNGYLAVMA